MIERTAFIDKNQSYLLGFLQSDGHRSLTHPNGIQIELSIKDRDILDKIRIEFSVINNVRTRTRDTNFKDDYASCSLAIHKSSIVNIIDFIPFGKKSETVRPPSDVIYLEIDYWRGFIDGDGSIGFREGKHKPEPFISIATSSEYIARVFENFLFLQSYSKNHSNRNKRDEQFNITIAGCYAVHMANILYYPECLSLDRKMKEATLIISSSFLAEQKHLQFTREEDSQILLFFREKKALKTFKTPKISVIPTLTNRSKQTVYNRLKYLLKRGIDSQEKLYDIRYFI
jgi:hypothetical protein